MDYLDASTQAEFEAVATVLQAVQDRARTCGVDIMLVGAAARDILIRNVVGSAPERATRDVDIAVAVNSWSEVECLTSSMNPTRGGAHTFLVLGIEVDVIPFGGIESRDRTITWPNDHEMDVSGFAEALRSAVRVKLPGDITVPVASLAAQSLLKLLAWRDRHSQGTKDDNIQLRQPRQQRLAKLLNTSLDQGGKRPRERHGLGLERGVVLEDGENSHVSCVKGHEDLPRGGHETCPVTVTSSAR